MRVFCHHLFEFNFYLPSWEESKRRLRSSTAAFRKTLRNIFLAVIRVQYNCTGNSKVKSFTLRIKRLTLNQRNIYYITGKGKGTNIIRVVQKKEILIVKKDIKRARCYESCLLLFTGCFDFNNQIFYMKSIQGVS